MNIVDWFDIENIEHLKAFYGIELAIPGPG